MLFRSLFTCPFIANAASFVLPIPTPANLVVYGKSLPPLTKWLGTFLVPSILSIGATYLALRLCLRKDLRGGVSPVTELPQLTPQGRSAARAIAASAAVL